MIRECAHYGPKWNDEPVENCPQCHPHQPRKEEPGIDREVENLIDQTIRSQRRIVNSHRKNEVARWERQHGKQIFDTRA